MILSGCGSPQNHTINSPSHSYRWHFKKLFKVLWNAHLMYNFTNTVCTIPYMYMPRASCSHPFTSSPPSSLPTIRPRECVLAWNEHFQEFHKTSWKSVTCPCGSPCCTVWPFSTPRCRYAPLHGQASGRGVNEGMWSSWHDLDWEQSSI